MPLSILLWNQKPLRRSAPWLLTLILSLSSVVSPGVSSTENRGGEDAPAIMQPEDIPIFLCAVSSLFLPVTLQDSVLSAVP